MHRRRGSLLGFSIALLIVSLVGIGCASAGEDLVPAGTSASAGSSTTARILPTTTEAAATTASIAPVTTASTKSEYEWAFGESVSFDDMVITVESPIEDKEPRNADEGKTVWLALVTIRNERAQPLDYSPVYFSLVDTDGFVYDYAIVLPSKPELDSAALVPGKTVKGYVSFQLPESASPAQVVFQGYSDAGQKWLALWE